MSSSGIPSFGGEQGMHLDSIEISPQMILQSTRANAKSEQQSQTAIAPRCVKATPGRRTPNYGKHSYQALTLWLLHCPAKRVKWDCNLRFMNMLAGPCRFAVPLHDCNTVELLTVYVSKAPARRVYAIRRLRSDNYE